MTEKGSQEEVPKVSKSNEMIELDGETAKTILDFIEFRLHSLTAM